MDYTSLINLYSDELIDSNRLIHYGVIGQKWGKRQYQYENGSYTPLGRIHYGIGEARKNVNSYAKVAKNTYSNAKIDVLDNLNRKGILDFLDSKADDPFKAKREALNIFLDSKKDTPISSIGAIANKESVDDFVSGYKSRAYLDVNEAFKKVRRYSDMVVGMRANEPYVKIEDTSKPWKETFRNGMMGWNHLSDIEKDVTSKAGDKLSKYISEGNNSDLSKQIKDLTGYERPDLVGQRLTSGGIFRYTSDKEFTKSDHNSILDKVRSQYLSEYSKRTGLSGFGWDKPMDIKIADGDKINAVIYANGGGVQGMTPSSKQRVKKIADEVTDYIERTGKLPERVISNPQRFNNDSPAKDFIDLYENEVRKWVISHDGLYLVHHGIKGQKWGERRYQNNDGSLTPLGRVHYGVGAARKGIENFTKKANSITKDGTHKLAESIQKKVKPTDKQLDEQLNIAKQKMEIRAKKQAIKEMNLVGTNKRKKLKDMNDQEVINYLNRLKNESEIRKYEKEKNANPIGKFFEEYLKQGISRGMNKALENAISNMIDDKKPKTYQDALREQKAKMELMAINGDNRAMDDMKRMGYLKNKDKDKDKDKDTSSNTQSNSSHQNEPKHSEKKHTDVLNEFIRDNSSRDTNDYSTPKYTKEEQKENRKTANKYNFNSDDNRSLISNNSLLNDAYKRKKR